MAESSSKNSLRHRDVIVPRGFPVEIIDTALKLKYTCAICRLILKEPLQSFCGHRFCRRCAEHLVQVTQTCDHLICPICQDEKTEDGSSLLHLQQMFPDNALRREMSSLPVHCCNAGCQWTGQFKDYERHFDNCEFLSIQCEYCSEEIQREMMDDHLMKRHLLESTKPGHLCPFNCGMTINESGIRNHIETNLTKHLEILSEKQLLVEDQVVTPAHSSQDLPSTLMERLYQMEDLVQRLEERSSNAAGVSRRQVAATSVSMATLGAQKKEIHREGDWPKDLLEILIRGAQVVKTEQERLSRRCQSYAIQCTEDRRKEEEMKGALEAQERMITRRLDFSALEARVEMFQRSSMDGNFIWKISEFNKRRYEAVHGVSSCLSSPPFYTSTTGYKLCAFVYLNGNGIGKGSHVSLSVAVMRGPFDPLLLWPFRQRLTAAIVDQKNGHRSQWEDCFRTQDTANGCCIDPIAAAFPQILSLKILDSPEHCYVRDDVMFIRISVDPLP